MITHPKIPMCKRPCVFVNQLFKLMQQIAANLNFKESNFFYTLYKLKSLEGRMADLLYHLTKCVLLIQTIKI